MNTTWTIGSSARDVRAEQPNCVFASLQFAQINPRKIPIPILKFQAKRAAPCGCYVVFLIIVYILLWISHCMFNHGRK